MSTVLPADHGRTAGSWLRRMGAAVRQRPWLLPIFVVLLVPGLLALFAGLIALALYLIMVLWAWTVPDLFPGAVAQGLVAGAISWLTALKVLLVLLFCGAIAGAAASHKQQG